MPSAERAISNLLARYAECLDAGDFDGLGALFAHGTVRFTGSDDVVRGAGAVGAMYASVVQVHGDSPLTSHVMSNVRIEVDPDGQGASAHSYYTVFQAHEDLPLQAVACGRYIDRFAKNGIRWQFDDRLIHRDLVGDLRYHLRRDPYVQ